MCHVRSAAVGWCTRGRCGEASAPPSTAPPPPSTETPTPPPFGFEVLDSGSGFGVWGLRSRMREVWSWGFGFVVWGLEFGVGG